jgi:exo-beta-1,3-glucanase (GH17 family)
MTCYKCAMATMATAAMLLLLSLDLHANLCWGLAYSPFRANQTPAGGPQPTVQQILEDMPRLAALTSNARTYSVAGYQSEIPALAHKYGISTWVGGWLNSDREANDAEMKTLIAASKQPGVAAVIVGNEVLYRKDLTPDQLIGYIRQVKKSVSVPVAYSDGWYSMRMNPDVVDAVDIALINIHPYWEGIAVEDAAKYVFDRYEYVQTRYPKKQIVIGEVGWPSAGPDRKAAKASEENEAAFLASFLELSKTRPDIRYFLFSSYDEPWKIEGGSTVGSHWGLHYSDGSTKRRLVALFGEQRPQPERLAAAGAVIENGKLAPGFDMGVDSSAGQRTWAIAGDSDITLAYPSGQEWGAAFITVGTLEPDRANRGVRDYSRYADLVLELKGTRPNESIEVGVKTGYDADDGSEPKFLIKNITDGWQTYRVPLDKLYNSDFSRKRFEELYVVTEFVFTGDMPHTISVRNVRFEADTKAAGRISRSSAGCSS